jgi:hypothetical protein
VAEPEAYRAEYLAQSPAPRLWPGQTAVAWIRRRNVGRATRRRDGQPPVLLGTDRPPDSPPVVEPTPAWPPTTRMARLSEAAVRPGEVGTFEVVLRAPRVPGPVLPGHAVDIAVALPAPSQDRPLRGAVPAGRRGDRLVRAARDARRGRALDRGELASRGVEKGERALEDRADLAAADRPPVELHDRA